VGGSIVVFYSKEIGSIQTFSISLWWEYQTHHTETGLYVWNIRILNLRKRVFCRTQKVWRQRVWGMAWSIPYQTLVFWLLSPFSFHRALKTLGCQTNKWNVHVTYHLTPKRRGGSYGRIIYPKIYDKRPKINMYIKSVAFQNKKKLWHLFTKFFFNFLPPTWRNFADCQISLSCWWLYLYCLICKIWPVDIILQPTF